jgi:ribose-phosphate pyrophosphokinase
VWHEMVILAGTAHPELSRRVTAELGVEAGPCTVERFPDGETSVHLEVSVRGKHVFLLQPTCPPVNDNLVQLFALADACRRAAAGRVTALVPYYGYARADKRYGRREPITASLVAALMRTAGIDHVVTVDLHTIQTEGFFQGPFDTLTAVPTLAEALRRDLPAGTVVVSPDAGRVKLATEYAERLDAPLAVLHKRRESGAETRVTHLVGEVAERPCLLIDDMISTGGTLVESVRALRGAGAPRHFVAATHGLLLDGAMDRLAGAGVEAVYVTDTVPLPAHEGLRVVSAAPLLAAAVRQLATDASLEALF